MDILIIGANSTLGQTLTEKLCNLDHNITIIDQNRYKLEALKKKLNEKIEILPMNISSTYNSKKLFNKFSKDNNVDVIINCLDLKNEGHFLDTSIDDDLNLIDMNIATTHTITKLFLKHFIQKNDGYIFNILNNISNNSSITYLATKDYIKQLTLSIKEELNVKKANVHIYFYDKEIKDVDLFTDEIINNIKK